MADTFNFDALRAFTEDRIKQGQWYPYKTQVVDVEGNTYTLMGYTGDRTGQYAILNREGTTALEDKPLRDLRGYAPALDYENLLLVLHDVPHGTGEYQPDNDEFGYFMETFNRDLVERLVRTAMNTEIAFSALHELHAPVEVETATSQWVECGHCKTRYPCETASMIIGAQAA